MAGAGTGRGPCSGADPTTAQGQRRSIDGLHAQEGEPDADAHHVNDAVDGADLVEVDVLDRCAVDGTLSASKPLKGPESPDANLLIQGGGLDDGADLAPVTLGLSRLDIDVEPGAGNSMTARALGTERIPGEAETSESAIEGSEIEPGVEQCGQEHIAGRAVEAVEVSDLHIANLQKVTPR